MEKIFFSYGESPKHYDKLTLLLGTFDGFHLGHRSLVLEAKKKSEGPIAVLLFDHSPSDFLERGKSKEILTSLEDKLLLFDTAGVDVAYIIHLDKAFLNVSKNDFIENVLKRIGPSLIVVGKDYTFGKFGEGDVAYLSSFIPVDSVDLLEMDGHKVSTQRLVSLIHEGKFEIVTEELGRNYEIKGVIAHGKEVGRKMGFPTANLAMKDNYALPKDGVYLTLSYLRGVPYKSLTNIGKNPTFGDDNKRTVESYLENFDGNAYGETLYISFLSFIRGEKKFSSLEELKEQIELDKQYLKR